MWTFIIVFGGASLLALGFNYVIHEFFTNDDD